VAGEVESGVLTAQIRVPRGGASEPVFVLDVSVAVPCRYHESFSGRLGQANRRCWIVSRDSCGRLPDELQVGDRVLFDSSVA
jgi:hypothetical protein